MMRSMAAKVMVGSGKLWFDDIAEHVTARRHNLWSKPEFKRTKLTVGHYSVVG